MRPYDLYMSKVALNAQALREVAQGHGVLPVPGSNWRGAARVLARGKTPQDVGFMTDKQLDVIMRQPRIQQIEHGLLYDQRGDVKGFSTGTPSSVGHLVDHKNRPVRSYAQYRSTVDSLDHGKYSAAIDKRIEEQKRLNGLRSSTKRHYFGLEDSLGPHHPDTVKAKAEHDKAMQTFPSLAPELRALKRIRQLVKTRQVGMVGISRDTHTHPYRSTRDYYSASSKRIMEQYTGGDLATPPQFPATPSGGDMNVFDEHQRQSTGQARKFSIIGFGAPELPHESLTKFDKRTGNPVTTYREIRS